MKVGLRDSGVVDAYFQWSIKTDEDRGYGGENAIPQRGMYEGRTLMF